MITDTERLAFLVSIDGQIRIGYPSVSFVGEDKSPNWGHTTFYLVNPSIEALREQIDYCIEQYKKHLEYAKKRSFD